MLSTESFTQHSKHYKSVKSGFSQVLDCTGNREIVKTGNTYHVWLFKQIILFWPGLAWLGAVGHCQASPENRMCHIGQQIVYLIR